MKRISEFLALNEEQSLILHPERKLAVRAGAGSGKTRAIIARYLRILEAGEADIPQIVAVTFTENAAAELKSRIRTEISEIHQHLRPQGEYSRGVAQKVLFRPHRNDPQLLRRDT